MPVLECPTFQLWGARVIDFILYFKLHILFANVLIFKVIQNKFY